MAATFGPNLAYVGVQEAPGRERKKLKILIPLAREQKTEARQSQRSPDHRLLRGFDLVIIYVFHRSGLAWPGWT